MAGAVQELQAASAGYAWANLLPSLEDTAAQRSTKILNLEDILRTKRNQLADIAAAQSLICPPSPEVPCATRVLDLDEPQCAAGRKENIADPAMRSRQSFPPKNGTRPPLSTPQPSSSQLHIRSKKARKGLVLSLTPALPLSQSARSSAGGSRPREPGREPATRCVFEDAATRNSEQDADPILSPCAPERSSLPPSRHFPVAEAEAHEAEEDAIVLDACEDSPTVLSWRPPTAHGNLPAATGKTRFVPGSRAARVPASFAGAATPSAPKLPPTGRGPFTPATVLLPGGVAASPTYVDARASRDLPTHCSLFGSPAALGLRLPQPLLHAALSRCGCFAAFLAAAHSSPWEVAEVVVVRFASEEGGRSSADVPAPMPRVVASLPLRAASEERAAEGLADDWSGSLAVLVAGRSRAPVLCLSSRLRLGSAAEDEVDSSHALTLFPLLGGAGAEDEVSPDKRLRLGAVAVEHARACLAVAEQEGRRLAAGGLGGQPLRLRCDPLWKSYSWLSPPPPARLPDGREFEDLAQLAFVPGTRDAQLVAASSAGDVAVWNLDTNQLLAVCPSRAGFAPSLCPHPAPGGVSVIAAGVSRAAFRVLSLSGDSLEERELACESLPADAVACVSADAGRAIAGLSSGALVLLRGGDTGGSGAGRALRLWEPGFAARLTSLQVVTGGADEQAGMLVLACWQDGSSAAIPLNRL